MEPSEVVGRIAADERQARDWALVLQAAGIACRIAREPRGWALVVDAAEEQRAAHTLAAYDEDFQPEPAVVEYGPTIAGAVMAGLLLAARGLTGYRVDRTPWFLAGEAGGRQILDGELWRTVTALTLHADPVHLLGNVAAMAVFATAVCRLLGPGLGAWVILVSGAAGNAVTAWLRGSTAASVGASTAIFGAVGILAGLAVVRPVRRHRRWVPIAAGLALLAMLGTGEQADLAAHFFGFVAGLGLAMGARFYADPLPGFRAQCVLGVGAFLVVAGCWLLAIGARA